VGSRPLAAALAVAVFVAAACTGPGGPRSEGRDERQSELAARTASPLPLVQLVVVDEAGDPVVASLRLSDGTVQQSGPDGVLAVAVPSPISGVVSAEGHLDEPVILDPARAGDEVRLFRRVGPDGTRRVAMQFGGDVMLGRRYLSPGRPGTARVITGDGGASARAVVSDLAPVFAAADLSTVNLETVVGDLPDAGAAAGKRYLLQSPPEIVDLLEELGVDAVTLGNNHVNDWQTAGVDATLAALDAAGMPQVGAGADTAAAQRGIVLDAAGVSVGMLSFTSVNGDVVNDDLPTAEEAPPEDLRAEDRWAYERRVFGYGTPGAADHLPTEERLPGEAWRAFTTREDALDDAAGAALWAALTAPGAYPELQDWVARRGHAGAAGYDRAALQAGIADLRERGADIVVVQVHAGFQFSEFTSEFTSQAGQVAIAAGADLVVGHHPHVLQGFEWYEGSLIAASLGNLVFDQDFLSTFASATLRVVMAGGTVLDARAIPVVLDSYRPVPAAGDTAAQIIGLLDARSASPARAQRQADKTVAGVLGTTAAAHAVPATVSAERGTGRIGKGRDTSTFDMSIRADGVTDLNGQFLIKADRNLTGVEFGRDLLGAGGFDDDTADGRDTGGLHWQVDPEQGSSIRTAIEREGGEGLVLRLEPRARAAASARPVARVTRADHRYVDGAGKPADGIAGYSLRLDARRTGRATLQARIEVFHVDDTDPNRDPSSTLIRRHRLTIPVPADTAWHRVEVALPPELFTPSRGLVANTALLHLEVTPDAHTIVEVDDVTVLEWRAADAFPDGTWHQVAAVRAEPGRQVPLTVS
jgi:poly-gamma-glutamate capsule biosynthesis protein CapA/YwtB (metallophosphatase superfamily)